MDFLLERYVFKTFKNIFINNTSLLKDYDVKIINEYTKQIIFELRKIKNKQETKQTIYINVICLLLIALFVYSHDIYSQISIIGFIDGIDKKNIWEFKN
jgi:preprotein translocase subunit SecE